MLELFSKCRLYGGTQKCTLYGLDDRQGDVCWRINGAGKDSTPTDIASTQSPTTTPTIQISPSIKQSRSSVGADATTWQHQPRSSYHVWGEEEPGATPQMPIWSPLWNSLELPFHLYPPWWSYLQWGLPETCIPPWLQHFNTSDGDVVIMDFKEAERNAFSFPDSSVEGCWFQFYHALLRWLSTHGMKIAYESITQHPATGRCIQIPGQWRSSVGETPDDAFLRTSFLTKVWDPPIYNIHGS